MLNDAVSVRSTEKNRKSKKYKLAEMNLQPVGVASVMLKSRNAYCARSTCELSLLQTPHERQRERRAEII